MFKKVSPKDSFETASPDGDESDDDAISLTSTVSARHDSDEEFEVENILAEQESDGMTYYLVEWTGFPLHECTWEPETGLGADLKSMWEENKAKHAIGELEPFDVRKFYDALRKVQEAKDERHRRRNAKRKKLGLPLTPPFPDRDASDDETAEERGAGGSAREPAARRRAPNQQKISKDSPSPAPASLPSSTASTDGPGPRSEARLPSIANQGLGPAASTANHRSVPSSSSKQNQTAGAASTGYQGTARKPSKTPAEAVSKLKTRPAVPSSVRPTQKKLTAKKSTMQPTGNIFTGGKMRKPRANLDAVISDPTKEPKFFGQLRKRRIAEKRSRDKEDLAPDLSKMRLFDITKGPSSRQSSAGSVQITPQQIPQEMLTPTERDPAPPATRLEYLDLSAAAAARGDVNAHQSATSFASSLALANSDVANPRKKRKVVRFLEDDNEKGVIVQEPEPMDLVDSPTGKEPSQGPSSSLAEIPPQALNPNPGPKKPSLSLDQSRYTMPQVQGSQTSQKRMILGLSSIEATFYGLPMQSSTENAWLADFLARETLEIHHTCFAKTVAVQIKPLVQKRLASGTIVSKQSEKALEQVAEYLTSGLLGLYHGQQEYNILVYPTKCDEWKSDPFSQGPTSPSGAPLRYFIFSSSQDCKLMLPPLSSLSVSPPAAETSEPEVQVWATDPPSARELMLKRLFGFSYTKLLPAIPRPLPAHIFFLAIPKSRAAIEAALIHRLRDSNPSCQIFTSNDPGSWAAFRARLDTLPGVVIIHEMLAWSIRRFPNLSRYLLSRNDEYWCLSEAVHGSPLYPSASLPQRLAPPGDVHFTRLFPYRTAILLTPSFLVSEPRRTFEFLHWFMSKWAKQFHYRLVTACNIHEYLLELADEKYKARQDLFDHPGDPEIAANLCGLSSDDCKFRRWAAELADEIHIIRTAKAGPDGHDEDNSPLVYADPSIDPNDEQSLVNWFAWWTTLRADQFRRFHVVGSSQANKFPQSRRGERLVRIPKYTKVTLNDPDAVMEVLHERDDQVEAELDDSRTTPHLPADGDQVQLSRQSSGSFKSNLIRSGDSASMISYLSELCAMPSFQLVLYKFPVSWLDFVMADHFEDYNLRGFHRINDWFSFAWPFGARTGFNTYVGFFYTITEDWDPEKRPESKLPERHPWIAIYRPVNPHLKGYRRCEVIIWDPAARTKFSATPRVAEKDLIFMQRQVIQYIRDHGDEKNPGTWVDQVWLGGLEWPSDCNSLYPLDVTLLFLRKMLGNIKEFLPAPEHAMEGRGYRRVTLEPSSSQANCPPADDAESSLFVDQGPGADHGPVDVDSSEGVESSEDEDTRIIFHPPRGNRSLGPFRSKCANRLYEEARLARARAGPGAKPTHMKYRFPPTMDWYSEQVAEGRGYAHIDVDSWEPIFNLLKVGKGAEKAASEGGAKSTASEGRRDSTASA
ncbi:hypothetical protein VTK56DRAFT_2352 [Thermocarpiscus australiensis]